jgi:hypothetical protein
MGSTSAHQFLPQQQEFTTKVVACINIGVGNKYATEIRWIPALMTGIVKSVLGEIDTRPPGSPE